MNRLFTVSSFESDFPLVLDVDGEKGKKIVMPEGIRYVFQLGRFISYRAKYLNAKELPKYRFKFKQQVAYPLDIRSAVYYLGSCSKLLSTWQRVRGALSNVLTSSFLIQSIIGAFLDLELLFNSISGKKAFVRPF